MHAAILIFILLGTSLVVITIKHTVLHGSRRFHIVAWSRSCSKQGYGGVKPLRVRFSELSNLVYRVGQNNFLLYYADRI